MFFITIDKDNFITGMYDGSKDYVHRVTGEPMADAVQIPDDAFPIMDICVAAIKSAAPTHKAVWNPTKKCIDKVVDDSVAGLRNELYSKRVEPILRAERERIDTLSETQLKSELGA